MNINMFLNRLMCSFGLHTWLYKDGDTGIYLHTQGFKWTGHMRCDHCDKREYISIKRRL